MATKVNTKFVVGLLAVMLVAVGGVGFLAMRAFTASGERQAARGDEAMVRYEQALAAGNDEEARRAIREAASAYERAVGREQARLDWLEKWHEALLLVTPTSPTDASRLYQWYRQIPRSIAMLRPEDPQRSLDYLERFWEAIQGRVDVPEMSGLITEVEALARRLPAEHPQTHAVWAYKGKAIVQLMGVTTVDEERREEGRRLLEEAVDALPDDPTPRLWLARWHLADARLLSDARRTQESAEAFEAGAGIAEAALERFPEAIDVKLLAFDITRQRVVREGGTDMRERLTPIMRDMIETMQRMPIEALETNQIALAGQFAQALGLAEESAASVSLQEAYAAAHADRPVPWLTLAQMYERRGEHAKQMEAAGRVLALPDPTVGLDSLRMPQFLRMASEFQVDSALAQWESATSEDERRRFEKLSEEMLAQLTSRVQATHSFLLSDRRGRIAVLRGNYGEAIAQLADAVRGYETAGTAPPLTTLRNLATALERTNNPGEARQAWVRVLRRATESGREDPLARLRIGSLSADLREYEMALEELQAASDLLGGSGKATALFAIGRLYEVLLDRGETMMVGGTRLTEQQLIGNAVEAFEGVRALSPDNEQVSQALMRLAARSGQGGDPEMMAVFNASRAMENADFDGALRMLDEAIAAGHASPRVWMLKVDSLSRSGRLDQAIAAAEEASSLYPNNAAIERYLRLARADDPTELALQDIEDPFQRAMARVQVAASRNDRETMEAALDEARSIDANNPQLIELEFELAIQRREWERAGTLARRAADRNTDQVGGLLFQGRLQYARGNYVEAVRVLRQAVEQLEFNPVAWRWLGLSQMRLGRTNDAVESLARAVQGRPSDMQIARDYANALVRVGRGQEALRAIDDETGVLRFGRRSPEMVELWLDLAVRFGGSEGRERALEERRLLYQRDPSNAVNAARLAEALFDIEAWGEAESIIDGLRNNDEVNRVAVAALRSRWLQRQGRMQEAVGSFDSFISSDPALRDSAEAMVAFGDLLLEFGMPDEALERFRLADERSAEGELAAATRLGDLYFRAGSQGLQTADQFAAQGMAEQASAVREQSREYLGESIGYFKRVLGALDAAANPDGHAAIGIQLAEADLRLERFSEAEQTLRSLSTLQENDLRRLILRARIASGRGDNREAQRIMDNAVREHPNDAVAFLNRARINAPDEALIVDVLADLDRAAELQPSNIEIWQFRVAVLRDRGEMNSAVASLRSAIQLNPNQDNLRHYLIDTLINAGRAGEAADEAIRLSDARPADTDTQARTIMLLQQVGRWSDAARLLARLREAEPNNPSYAASWLDSRLNAGSPPAAAQANPALRVVRSAPAYGTPNQPVVWSTIEARMTHALEQAAQQARDEGLARRYADESRAALARGLRLAGTNPGAANNWFNAATTVLGSGQMALQFARATLGEQPLPPILRAIELNLRMIAAGSDRSAMLELIESADSLLAELGDDPAVRMELLKSRGVAATQIGQHAKAVESFEAILEITPNDGVSLNNLAYLLATELNEPERALGYAQRAQSLAPENPTVLDTLGAVYLSFSPPRFADAERVLRRAVTFATTPDELFPANVHLGQALLGMEMAPQARSAAEAARRAMGGADESLRQIYEPQLEELENRLRR